MERAVGLLPVKCSLMFYSPNVASLVSDSAEKWRQQCGDGGISYCLLTTVYCLLFRIEPAINAVKLLRACGGCLGARRR